jgi:hypothetical protein
MLPSLTLHRDRTETASNDQSELSGLALRKRLGLCFHTCNGISPAIIAHGAESLQTQSRTV